MGFIRGQRSSPPLTSSRALHHHAEETVMLANIPALVICGAFLVSTLYHHFFRR